MRSRIRPQVDTVLLAEDLFPVFGRFDKLAVMAALKPVNGVLKIRFVHDIGADTDVGCHLFYYVGTPATQAQVDSVTQAAHTAYGANNAALLNNLNSLLEVNTIDLSASTGFMGSANTPIAGTRAGAPPPANAVAMMRWTPVRRYRGGKPRTYWPWGSIADVANPQEWTDAFIAQCQTAMDALNGAIVTNLQTWAAGARLASVSYFAGREWIPDHLGNYHRVPTARDTPIVDYPRGTYSFSKIIGSQRPRLRPN